MGWSQELQRARTARRHPGHRALPSMGVPPSGGLELCCSLAASADQHLAISLFCPSVADYGLGAVDAAIRPAQVHDPSRHEQRRRDGTGRRGTRELLIPGRGRHTHIHTYTRLYTHTCGVVVRTMRGTRYVAFASSVCRRGGRRWGNGIVVGSVAVECGRILVVALAMCCFVLRLLPLLWC